MKYRRATSASLFWTRDNVQGYRKTMHLDWNLLLLALGLAFLIEGMPYFLFAERMPRILRALSERSPRVLRGLGLMAIVVGLAILLLARQLGVTND